MNEEIFKEYQDQAKSTDNMMIIAIIIVAIITLFQAIIVWKQ